MAIHLLPITTRPHVAQITFSNREQQIANQKQEIDNATNALKERMHSLGINNPSVGYIGIPDGRGPYLMVQVHSSQERTRILSLLTKIENYEPRHSKNLLAYVEEGFRLKDFLGIDIGLFDVAKASSDLPLGNSETQNKLWNGVLRIFNAIKSVFSKSSAANK